MFRNTGESAEPLQESQHMALLRGFLKAVTISGVYQVQEVQSAVYDITQVQFIFLQPGAQLIRMFDQPQLDIFSGC